MEGSGKRRESGTVKKSSPSPFKSKSGKSVGGLFPSSGGGGGGGAGQAACLCARVHVFALDSPPRPLPAGTRTRHTLRLRGQLFQRDAIPVAALRDNWPRTHVCLHARLCARYATCAFARDNWQCVHRWRRVEQGEASGNVPSFPTMKTRHLSVSRSSGPSALPRLVQSSSKKPVQRCLRAWHRQSRACQTSGPRLHACACVAEQRASVGTRCHFPCDCIPARSADLQRAWGCVCRAARAGVLSGRWLRSSRPPAPPTRLRCDCMRVRVCVYMHVCGCGCISMWYSYVHVCMHMCVCMTTCVYTHTRTHTHTHTHTLSLSLSLSHTHTHTHSRNG